MSRIVTEILPVERWPLIAPIMSEVFHNGMPSSPRQSTFHAAMDGDRLAGFIHVEQLFHLNTLYVDPAYRHTKLAYEMAHEVETLLSTLHGFSAIVLTDGEKQIERLMKRFGARDVGMRRLLRKDY